MEGVGSLKSALVTGVTGQDGSYLAELLLKKGYKVFGLARRKSIRGYDNILNVVCNKNFIMLEGDLLEESRLNEMIRDNKFDEVYNLAAQTFIPYSWINPIYTSTVNCLSVVRLLEAIRIYSPDTKFYQASSSLQFGNINSSILNEKSYHYPVSPYACSKSFGFNLVRCYRENFDLFACNGIAFNHESERRGLDFVTRKIARGVAEISLGLKDRLTLGNLDTKRDWGYAPDYVDAMYRIMQHKVADDFVIASGENHTIKEFVEIAFGCIGIDISWVDRGLAEKGVYNGCVLVDVSKDFYRPSEVYFLKGDISKIKSVLGWSSKTSFKDMIKRIVDNDIRILSGGT